jgi:hypothetical protein
MLEAYGDERRLVAMQHVTGYDVDEAIETMLSDDGVRYVHVRNAEAGCFMAQASRRGQSAE